MHAKWVHCAPVAIGTSNAGKADSDIIRWLYWQPKLAQRLNHCLTSCALSWKTCCATLIAKT